MKEIDIDFIVREVGSDSINSGQYGDVKRIPKVEQISTVGPKKCENQKCSGRMYLFNHQISKIRGECTRYDPNEIVFTWDSDLDEFELDGEYCPICERAEIRINDMVVHENEGIEIDL